MPGVRLIDDDQRERKKPMRVLVLGMCRTGTTSICLALRKLGYTPYQMREILVKPKDLELWQEALSVTLLPEPQRPWYHRGGARPYGRKEFDKLLGEFDAVADIPAALFGKQLVEAYPDAKVILTTRRYEDWEKTMQTSVWLLLRWRLFIICRKLNVTQIAPLTQLMHSLFNVHNGNCYGGPKAREAYEKHNEDVRNLVPKERLLEIGEVGEWDPLCDFLETGPEQRKDLGPYPNTEENSSMETGLRRAWWLTMRWVLLMFGLVVVTTLGAVAIYYERQIWTWFQGLFKYLDQYARLDWVPKSSAKLAEQRAKDEL